MAFGDRFGKRPPRSLEEQTNSFASYLPTGRAWGAKNLPGTVMRGLLEGFAGELIRNEALIAEFRDEIIPDETNLFISEWEQALAIPDDCFTGAGTDDERRRDVLAKLASLGVQTAEDMRVLALSIYGIELIVTTPAIDDQNIFPYTFNLLEETPDPEGDAGTFFFNVSDKQSRFQIIIEYTNLPEPVVFPYTFPIPFLTREIAVIQCLFEKIRPANVGFTQQVLIPTQSSVPPPTGPGFSKQLKSLDFDDTFDMRSATAATVGITDTFSISVWAKNLETSPDAGNDGIYCIRSGAVPNSIDMTCEVSSNDNLQVVIVNSVSSARQNKVWDSVIEGGASAPWKHYVLTWGGDAGTGVDGLHLYVDGIDQGVADTVTSDLDGTSMTDTIREIRIGGRVGVNDRWLGPSYSGALWDKVLAPAEVTALFNGGNARDFDVQTNDGAYVSASNLIHYNRLGFGDTDVEIGTEYVVGADLALEDQPDLTVDGTDLITDIPV